MPRAQARGPTEDCRHRGAPAAERGVARRDAVVHADAARGHGQDGEVDQVVDEIRRRLGAKAEGARDVGGRSEPPRAAFAAHRRGPERRTHRLSRAERERRDAHAHAAARDARALRRPRLGRGRIDAPRANPGGSRRSPRGARRRTAAPSRRGGRVRRGGAGVARGVHAADDGGSRRRRRGGGFSRGGGGGSTQRQRRSTPRRVHLGARRPGGVCHPRHGLAVGGVWTCRRAGE
mmetsp:Transcript_8468/g.38391  ORF Transcript_8468/g.38391 Transcript_8468/m.38391 type:complete len:234 (+) Transcript_8468:1230-1931(+)